MTSESAIFQIEEATIAQIQEAFKQNRLRSTQLVQHYLSSIRKLQGTLFAVIEINPDALADAFAADEKRKLSNPCVSGLEGIPVLLKDNIATKDKLNTTSGSFALLGSVVPRDAGVIDRLRRSGAIILGKVGLSEWANFRAADIPSRWSARGGEPVKNPYLLTGDPGGSSTGSAVSVAADIPSGWSARGGEPVKNPYLLSGDPGGSSTGSAVSVAANLGTVSLGTETNGSIMVPFSLNCVVGIKPTTGLTSRSKVIPISLGQDSVGPVGRTVSDAVALLNVIVGYDPRDDEMTREAARYIPRGGYKQFLKEDGLKGKRIGSMWSTFSIIWDPATSPIPQIFEKHFNTMR